MGVWDPTHIENSFVLRIIARDVRCRSSLNNKLGKSLTFRDIPYLRLLTAFLSYKISGMTQQVSAFSRTFDEVNVVMITKMTDSRLFYVMQVFKVALILF